MTTREAGYENLVKKTPSSTELGEVFHQVRANLVSFSPGSAKPGIARFAAVFRKDVQRR
jgi:hypothetical protein